ERTARQALPAEWQTVSQVRPYPRGGACRAMRSQAEPGNEGKRGQRAISTLVPRLCLGTHCPAGSACRVANSQSSSSVSARRSLPGNAFPGGAWERGQTRATRDLDSRSQALPGNALPGRLCLPSGKQSVKIVRIREAEPAGQCVPRRSLGTRANEGNARSRLSFPGSAWERTARQALPAEWQTVSQDRPYPRGRAS